MAQRLGLPSVPVSVKAVHREWWETVTQGATGQEALNRVRAALADCLPEIESGPLDPEPRRRVAASQIVFREKKAKRKENPY